MKKQEDRHVEEEEDGGLCLKDRYETEQTGYGCMILSGADNDTTASSSVPGDNLTPPAVCLSPFTLEHHTLTEPLNPAAQGWYGRAADCSLVDRPALKPDR